MHRAEVLAAPACLTGLPECLAGQVARQVPLAPLTTWRVGGPAEYFYQPEGLQDLVALLRWLPARMPLFWLGLGSNVLIRDGGVRGFVIHTRHLQAAIECRSDPQGPTVKVRAGAGVTCAKLAKFASKHGLAGAEFFCGIPGTVGGAVAMNAGAFGGETWRLVHQVEWLCRDGRVLEVAPSQFQVGYRQAIPRGVPPGWIVAVQFELPQGATESADARIKALLQKRKTEQPIGSYNCGSVFRNPEHGYAGQLIQESGLKGVRVGQAVVSHKHANYIINEGNATAWELETLIRTIQKRVWCRFGIYLQPEVCVVGQTA